MASHDVASALKGKVALVTGAGRGLGRAFAERLASLGADVAIHGMRENQLRSYDITVNCIAPGDTPPGGSWARVQSIKPGWSKPARSTASRPSTKSRAWWKCSRGLWVRSSRARCCASMAGASAGRGDGRLANLQDRWFPGQTPRSVTPEH